MAKSEKSETGETGTPQVVAKPDPMEKVWVLVESDTHTHAGVPRGKGDLLEIERHHAESIVRAKAGRIVPAPAQ